MKPVTPATSSIAGASPFSTEKAPKPSSIGPVFLGFILLWLLLDRTATALNSVRGEFGLLLGVMVIVAAVVAERLLFPRSTREALRALGFGKPTATSLLLTGVIGLLMLSFFPLYSALTGVQFTLADGWFRYLPGLFGQAGIAEEIIFRGFAFRHLRQGRTFGKAAFLSMLLFTTAHLTMFFTFDPAVALAGTLLAVATAAPLAVLFERSGNTVWPCALLHLVIQGAVKIVTIPEARMMPVALAWMGVCAVVPFLAFLLPSPSPPPEQT